MVGGNNVLDMLWMDDAGIHCRINFRMDNEMHFEKQSVQEKKAFQSKCIQ